MIYSEEVEKMCALLEKAASLVLFVLKVQGERQAVLQLGSEILDVPVLHALEPAGKIVHKGFGLVGRSFPVACSPRSEGRGTEAVAAHRRGLRSRSRAGESPRESALRAGEVA